MLTQIINHNSFNSICKLLLSSVAQQPNSMIHSEPSGTLLLEPCKLFASNFLFVCFQFTSLKISPLRQQPSMTSSEAEETLGAETAKMSLMPRQTTSPLERLPLELRLKIYQAYLDSPHLEYLDQRVHEWIQREHRKDINKLSITEAAYYRQDPNEGSGFWSPFGITACTDAEKRVRLMGFPDITPWAVPALWHVGGPIASEARDYMINERMRLVLTEPKALYILKVVLEDWFSNERREDVVDMWFRNDKLTNLAAIKKLYIDVDYCLSEFIAPKQKRGLRDRRTPLFKIEIRDEGSKFRVSTLYKLAADQFWTTSWTVQKAIKEKLAQPIHFDGTDIVKVVKALLPDIESKGQPRWFMDEDGDRQLAMGRYWEVDLAEGDLRKLQKGETASVQDRLIRPATYEHVIVECTAGREPRTPFTVFA